MSDVFQTSEILLYRGDRLDADPKNTGKSDETLRDAAADQTAFSVVACDQYTSEPEYWERVAHHTGGKPSALHLIFPEAYLKTADFDGTISSINRTMADYLERQLFRECTDTFLYVERTLRSGKVRHGLIGKLDLEEYSYDPGSQSKIRATEGTVLSRIPPRVKIRENAPLEFPHVMVLIDDREKTVIEPLESKAAHFEKAYSFDLMENSGHLTGYLLPTQECERIVGALRGFSDRAAFEKRYGVSDPEKGVLPYAVGDGNHSLATARKCYLNLKARIGEEAARNHPARYALVELVNLHDASLEFEAIHRIVTGIVPEEVIAAFGQRFCLSDVPTAGSQLVDIVTNGTVRRVFLTNPSRNLAVGSLQDFLDDYITTHDHAEIDYIHGEDVVKELSKKAGSIGFLLPCMEKAELFQTVIVDGALPRKTFSMGEACDKRFYFEARRIK